MKHTETLNSRSWAREARRHCRIRRLGKAWKHPGHEFIHAWTHTIPNLGWIQARPCYVYSRYCEETADGIRLHRRVEFTGGWIVTARAANNPRAPYRGNRKAFRVPGPVDLNKLARYIGAAERFLRTERRLSEARTKLHELVDSRDVPATISEQAARLGLPMAYSDMSLQNCIDWGNIAKHWPLKNPAPRTQA